MPSVQCPVCGGTNHRKLFIKDGFPYIKCHDCKLISVYPQPSDGELDNIYKKGYYSVWGENENVFCTMKRFLFSKLFDLYPALKDGDGKCLCDIGAATGILMEVARDFGYEVYGIECSDDGAECIKEKFGAERVLHDYFGNNDFAGIGWVNKFDVVVMYDLFEHVRDVDMALKKTAVILKPGGIVVIVSPDTSSWSCHLFGRRWPHFIPEHLFQFNKKNLSSLLTRHEFEKLYTGNLCKYLSLDYFAGVARKEFPGVLSVLFSRITALLPRCFSQKLYFPFWCGTMIGIFRKSDLEQ